MPLVAPFVESIGYDGTITEGQLAVWGAALGSLPVVLGDGSWKVTAVPGQPEPTIQIAPGAGVGDAVRDTTDAAFRMTLPVPSGTADRWDWITVRRDWRPTPEGTSAFTRVAGGSSNAAVPSSLAKNPGVVADQMLARVRVRGGSTAVQAIDDLRVVASPQYATLSDFAAALGRGGDAPAGTEVRKPNGEAFRYWRDAAGNIVVQGFVERGGVLDSAAGGMYTTRSASPVRGDANWKIWNSDTITLGEVAVPDPGRPYRLAVDWGFWAGAEGSGTRFDFFARVGSATGPQIGQLLCLGGREQERAIWRQLVTTPYNQVFTGSQKVYVVAERVYGTSRGEYHAPSGLLRATPFAA
ncbi:hypothetical protein WDZ16_12910 [Pseudokineococcus marinus]|uniref:Uncharacterized protein n=1 Tax=Pseudokineococcus marinus TaxID=351215 RepID=A0A849BJV3_9ACTN|nr:hypothetical protein [Pseudokineococcus marinus]NNH21635.1 hypothetical protein [Pseudokineococcus marinus]